MKMAEEHSTQIKEAFCVDGAAFQIKSASNSKVGFFL